jgi:hypothetical protein
MEPHVAKRLDVASAIFRSENSEPGVLTGDDGSSTTAACRAAGTHPTINLASGGVNKQFWSIEKSHKELIEDCIVYLH